MSPNPSSLLIYKHLPLLHQLQPHLLRLLDVDGKSCTTSLLSHLGVVVPPASISRAHHSRDIYGRYNPDVWIYQKKRHDLSAAGSFLVNKFEWAYTAL